jgi:iron complex outermembrane receptor protein
VVGSSRATTVLKAASPVDVVTPAQLNTGGVVLNQALQHLLPSFQFPQGQNASKGSSGIRSASLRGLSPDLTLVLVDGKRRHNSAQTGGVDPWPGSNYIDLNAIPISALSRVEVLRDGASAQYGSDAIAGVVNLVLRRDREGGGVNAEYGEYSKGDGRTKTISGWLAAALPNEGFINFSADLSDRGRTDRSGLDIRRRFFLVNASGQSVASSAAPTNYVPGTTLPAGLSYDPREATVNRKVGQWGNAEVAHGAYLLNSEIGLSEAVRAYAWLNYATTRTQNGVNPQVTSSDVVVRALFPDGFQPVTDVRLKDYAATAGLKIDGGALGNFDLGGNYGRNELKRYLHNLDAPSYGLASQKDFYLGKYTFEQINLNLDWTKDLDVGLASPAQFIGGATYRRETWDAAQVGDVQSYAYGGVPILDGPNAGVATRWGTADGTGLGPWDLGARSRDVYGGYLGVDVRPVEKLLIGVTGRVEHYSDFGWTTNGKVSARFDITRTLAIRGGVSAGYRAPSLGQIQNQSTGFSSNWSASGTVLATTRTRTYRPDSSVAIALGGGALEPEKSVNFSAGTVWQPSRDFSITIDAYHIKIKGLILTAGAATGNGLTGAAVLAATAAAGDPDITAVSFLTNGLDTRTRGVDVVARYQHDFDVGQVQLFAGYSLMSTKVSNVKTGLNGTVLFTRGAQIDLERGTPQNKLILTQTFSRGKFAVQFDQIRYGHYYYTHPTVAANDEYYKPDWYVNAEARVQPTPSTTFAVGGRNVFNVYPHQYKTANQVNGINRYGFIHPEGASGAYWYVRAGFKF